VGHGRRAAEAIARHFTGTPRSEDGMTVIRTDRMHLDHYEAAPRQAPAALDVEARLGAVDREVNLGLTTDQVIEESGRCMSCGYCFDCEKCWMYCQDQAIEKPMRRGVLYGWKLQNCTGCKKCAEICPCGFIEMA
jgi:formate dehydrogenase beta subunit